MNKRLIVSLLIATSTTVHADWYEASAKPSLVVRSLPDTSADKIGNVPYGEKIDVIGKTDKNATINGQTGTWVKVKWENETGYAFDAFLTKIEDASPQEQPAPTDDKEKETKSDSSTSLEVKEAPTSITEEEPVSGTDSTDKTKIIIVTGYGTDHDQALKNALQSAVEQQVGVLIDSETIIKNDELIKNEILTASNGFVQKYDEISTSANNGLTEVKIKAEVKTQAVAQKIKSLNIFTLKVQEDTSDIYAEVTTKEKSKEDRIKILKNTLDEIISKQSYYDLLDIKLNEYNILKDKSENGKTPVEIVYSINLNYPAYEERIKKLESTLAGIGAILKRKTDYPEMEEWDDKDTFRLTTSRDAEETADNSISIIKKDGKKYIRDTWEIPKEVDTTKINKNDYEKAAKNIDSYEENTINIELLDKENNLLNAHKLKKNIYRFIVSSYGSVYSTFSRGTTMQTGRITFAPFFSDGNDVPLSFTRNFNGTLLIDNEDLKNFSKVTIQYQ